MIVIGITGTLGAGKGTVVEYLVQKYGFSHYSVRKYLTKELSKFGKVPNRDNFTELANQLREVHQSPSFLIEELYREAIGEGRPAIIESIRTVGEIDKLKSLGPFYLLAVDGDRAVRYQRIIGRRSETDFISFEEFVEDEDREMHAIDPNKQNLHACMSRADFQILNNTTKEDLRDKVDHFMSQITSNTDTKYELS